MSFTIGKRRVHTYERKDEREKECVCFCGEQSSTLERERLMVNAPFACSKVDREPALLLHHHRPTSPPLSLSLSLFLPCHFAALSLCGLLEGAVSPSRPNCVASRSKQAGSNAPTNAFEGKPTKTHIEWRHVACAVLSNVRIVDWLLSETHTHSQFQHVPPDKAPLRFVFYFAHAEI